MSRLWLTTVESIRDWGHRSILFRWCLKLAFLMLILGGVGVLIAAIGIIPVKASAGHLAITRAILQFAKQRSVATHSAGISPPRLDDPVLVMKGAGHYDIGCRSCHGSPKLMHPKIAQHMLPAPPYLPETVRNWQSQELFYMVKHGIKFTGMPAWPAQQRDDEIWAMVAFLRTFPNLDAEEYQQLVHGTQGTRPAPNENTTQRVGSQSTKTLQRCSSCHGLQGEGRDTGAFPKLAGQSSEYFVETMQAFARGTRHSGIMEPIAAEISPSQIRELAIFYQQQAPKASPGSKSPTMEELGEQIANQGVPEQDIPACVDCHDPQNASANPNFPSLNGQHPDYIALQLKLFKEGRRGGTRFAHLMENVVSEMKAEQIQAVSNYFSRQQTQKQDLRDRSVILAPLIKR